jgi:transposase-like protein
MGPAQADRALDGSDLALRLSHWSHRVSLSVQMVPSGHVMQAILPARTGHRQDYLRHSQNLALGGDLMFYHIDAHGGDFMVTIATFNDSAKARQLKRRFEDQGLKVDVHNEAPLQEFGFMSKPQANAKVMVDDSDFEKAQSLMIEWEATDPDISAALIRCPQCNSSNIEYPQMTRKFLTPALVGLLCALKIIPKEFYCQDCHFTWTNREQPTIGRLWHRFFPGGETS